MMTDKAYQGFGYVQDSPYRWAGRGGSRNGILPITSNLKERNNVQNRKLYEVRLKDIDGNEIVIVELFAALPNAAGSEFNQTGIEDWTAKTGQTSICGEKRCIPYCY